MNPKYFQDYDNIKKLFSSFKYISDENFLKKPVKINNRKNSSYLKFPDYINTEEYKKIQ